MIFLRNLPADLAQKKGERMAPRPKKMRNCCRAMRAAGAIIYKPAGRKMSELEQIRLAPDEIAALHLCDGLGLTQEQAGTQMEISRGTVQRLVAAGRKKIIDALLEQKALLLQAEEESPDGDYLP
jgi:predicted DNA-binding protein (UPF0251 family)